MRSVTLGTRTAPELCMTLQPIAQTGHPAPQPTPSPNSVARSLAREFKRLGLSCVFTVTGGPLMPFLQACHVEGLKIIVCRHETNAAFSAAGHYLHSGTPALLALTSGPGAANAVNGIFHSLREQNALVVVSARPASSKVGRGAVQDLDTARFLAPFTKTSDALLHPEQCLHLARRSFATAVAHPPGPVNLTVCNDSWNAAVEEYIAR